MVQHYDRMPRRRLVDANGVAWLDDCPAAKASSRRSPAMRDSKAAMSEQEQPPAPDTPPEAAERPVLFLHIPKTAGTSLLLALQNLFGDARVLRLNGADPLLQETIDDIVARRLGELSCLAGHVPVHFFAPHLDRFRPFTLLRHPLTRVLSLYRFLRRAPEAALEAVGLSRDFGFEEFIGSRNHEVFAQVNNAMCRMLCGDARLSDPETAAFWRIDPDAAQAERALAMLQRFDFGLVEEMAATRELLRARWNLPYALDEYLENTTARDASAESIARLQMVIRRNMLDLALYQCAAALFHARVNAAEGGTQAAGQALFAPVLNQTTEAADIAGRQGFDMVEDTGVAWLRPERPARLYFRAPAGAAAIELRLYCLTADYPIEKIGVAVNGKRVPHKADWTGPHWFNLEAGPLGLRDEVNELAIDPPMFLSVRQFTPDTPDQRYLSVALASITFLG